MSRKEEILELVKTVSHNLKKEFDYPDAREDILGSGNANDIYGYGHSLGMIEGMQYLLDFILDDLDNLS